MEDKNQATLSEPKFTEALVIADEQNWIWTFATQGLTQANIKHVRVPANSPIRQSWDRFRAAPFIVIHWETRSRSGGAVIEEILDVQPNFDVGTKVIVLTANPTHEDVVYFNELGVRAIIRLRNRDKDLATSTKEFIDYLTQKVQVDPNEKLWRKLQYTLDTLPDTVGEDVILKLEAALAKLRTEHLTARYLDAAAQITALRQNDVGAVKGWYAALERNPNYYRSYQNLITFYRKKGRHTDAMALMQKMHELNKQKVSRLVAMGEIQMQNKDQIKAEFYFNSALSRDAYCSGALNGLAEIKFLQGDLEHSRRLLAKSSLAYKTAAILNQEGIELVKKEKFPDALDHYTKAQYVLPQQDKGPLLFYNIALCYARWGKIGLAMDFVKIALVKEPRYKKAQKLLTQLTERLAGGPLSVAS